MKKCDACYRPLIGTVQVRLWNANRLIRDFSRANLLAQIKPVAHSRLGLAHGLRWLDSSQLRFLANDDQQESVMMGSNVYEDRKVRELFDARFTVNEILERTGLTIDRIVRAINAPRVPKGSPGMKLRQSI